MQNIKRIIVPILLVSILVISGSIYASDVTDAKYLSTIRVTNNSTSPITDGIVVFDLSTAEMITSSMLNASASDCALLTGIGGSDLAFQPSVNSTYPWVAWVNSIRANAELYEYLYSKDATGGKISYFPGDAGMTVLDTLTEPLSNFSLRINNAYINTDASANKTLLSHYDTLAGGIRVYVSPTVSQNITATIYSYSSAVCLSYVGGDYLNRAAGVVMPSGGEITVEVLAYRDTVGTYDVIIDVGSFTNESIFLRFNADNRIQFSVGNAAATGTAVSWISTNTTLALTWYHIVATYKNGVGTIVYVNGDLWGGADGGGGGDIYQPNTLMYIGTSDTIGDPMAGDIEELRISEIARTQAEAVAAYNGGVCKQYSVDANTISLFHFNKNAGTTTADETGNNDLTFGAAGAAPTWVTTSPIPNTTTLTSVSATSVASGEYDIEVSANVTSFNLYIDGVLTDNATMVAVPNSTANWVVGSGNTTLYIGSIEYDVGGVPVSAWLWENGTTFHDSIGANDATPSFRTASSDSDLTAMVLLMTSTLEGSIPANPVLGGWDMITEVPYTPDNLFTEGFYDFPFGTQIVETADAMGQDRESWLFAFVFGLAILAALVVYGGTHRLKMGQRGSLLLATLAAGGVMFYFVTTGTIPGWSIIPVGIISIFIISWRKSVAPID